MSEAWDWYLRQKEGAKNKWEEQIRSVNETTNIPQHILAIKLCSDDLSEKDVGTIIFTERHVNQLMLLAYNIGVSNARSTNTDVDKAIKEAFRDAVEKCLED